jgi:transposase
MESTGIYWIPLYDMLEEYGFEVFLCNATQAKNLPGRQKTDYHDCVWIQKLHSYSLLNNSFIPELTIRDFRNLMRYRERLTQDKSRFVLRMQKLLTQMNILLPKVLSDITGKTGMSIIKAIISGNTEPEQLLKLKNNRVKASNKTFLKALQGNYDTSLIKLLNFELKQYETTDSLIFDVDKEIDITLLNMHISNSDGNSEMIKLSERDMLIAYTGVDLTEVPGFDILSIRKLIAETGTDMSKWKDPKHFTSWLRLSPHSKISGGKLYSSKTLKHKPRAAVYFRICANTLQSSKSYLGDFYRRKKAQKTPGIARTATARKLAVIYYNMLKYKISYIELGEDYYASKYKLRSIKQLHNYANFLGYHIVKNEE